MSLMTKMTNDTVIKKSREMTTSESVLAFRANQIENTLPRPSEISEKIGAHRQPFLASHL